jgi:hypothetical protein
MGRPSRSIRQDHLAPREFRTGASDFLTLVVVPTAFLAVGGFDNEVVEAAFLHHTVFMGSHALDQDVASFLTFVTYVLSFVA